MLGILLQCHAATRPLSHTVTGSQIRRNQASCSAEKHKRAAWFNLLLRRAHENCIDASGCAPGADILVERASFVNRPSAILRERYGARALSSRLGPADETE